jgi:small subunit ribosomal protein S24e
MKIDIIDKKEEALFQRETITARCEFDNVTPSRLELRNRLAAQLGVKEDLVVIKNIFTTFGARSGKVEACVYKDEKALKKVESDKMIKKNTPKKEEKPAEEAAAAPAEEKKEEKAEAA